MRSRLPAYPVPAGGRRRGLPLPGRARRKYARKGGLAEDAQDRRCLCNALLATIGLGQRRVGGWTEPPLVTLGQDHRCLEDLLHRYGPDYSAADVVDYLLGRFGG